MECKYCGQTAMEIENVDPPPTCSFCGEPFGTKQTATATTLVLGSGLNAVAAYWYFAAMGPTYLVAPQPPNHRHIGPFFIHAKAATTRFMTDIGYGYPSLSMATRHAEVGYYDGEQTKLTPEAFERERYVQYTRAGLSTSKSMNGSESYFSIYSIPPENIMVSVGDRLNGFTQHLGSVEAIDLRRKRVTIRHQFDVKILSYSRLVSTMPWHRFVTAVQLGTIPSSLMNEVISALVTPWLDTAVTRIDADGFKKLGVDKKYDMVYNVTIPHGRLGIDRWFRVAPIDKMKDNWTLEKVYAPGDERYGWVPIFGGRPLYSANEISGLARRFFQCKGSSELLFLGRNGANKQMIFDDVLKALQGVLYGE